jgi:putative ATP-binding cassette transporter
VFAASTVVAVIHRYVEERLGMLWREWLTRRFIIGYANDRVYYRLKVRGEVGNPDQRIADDVRAYCTTTLSFVLMLLNGTLTVIAFSGVLWSISPLLFVVAVVYASAGTYFTFVLGRPLVHLNYDQLDKEANFRASLTYLRANAESVAVSCREGGLIQLSMRMLDDLLNNFRRIINVNRNLNFFTTGYNWLIQIIPALIIAPLFINGKVEFGVITQSAMAFIQLLGAFSLIVTQFQSISSYAAVISRLSYFMDARNKELKENLSAITFSKDPDRIDYRQLTLRSPRSGRVLIKELTLAIPHGRRVLVMSQDKTARTALAYATVGLWEAGEGHIARPGLDQLLLLPELPFLPPATLRELLLGPWPEEDGPVDRRLKAIQVSDEEMLKTLASLKIDTLLTGFGGLDKRHHWENSLPLSDQQLLVVARLLLAKPRFAFLHRPSASLSPEQVDWILGLLYERAISYVNFEEGPVNFKLYDDVLELQGNGAWTYKPVGG